MQDTFADFEKKGEALFGHISIELYMGHFYVNDDDGLSLPLLYKVHTQDGLIISKNERSD